MEDCRAHSYFAGVPQGLAKSCDTVLLLDDGTKLPAHAAILALHSELFSDMLDEGPLAEASRNKVVVVPVSECTEDVAKRLLPIIYTSDYQEYITESSAWSLADLGHKLNIKVDHCSSLPLPDMQYWCRPAGNIYVSGSRWRRQGHFL